MKIQDKNITTCWPNSKYCLRLLLQLRIIIQHIKQSWSLATKNEKSVDRGFFVKKKIARERNRAAVFKQRYMYILATNITDGC